MRNDTIFGIYTHKNGTLENPAAYYILHLFNHTGSLDREVIEKVYSNYGNHKHIEDGAIGPFESLDTLKKFGFGLVDELNAPAIGLIADHQYNQLLEEATTTSELAKLQFQHANMIENPDKENSGGIFGKLFS